jgi:hypothetical protein
MITPPFKFLIELLKWKFSSSCCLLVVMSPLHYCWWRHSMPQLLYLGVNAFTSCFPAHCPQLCYCFHSCHLLFHNYHSPINHQPWLGFPQASLTYCPGSNSIHYWPCSLHSSLLALNKPKSLHCIHYKSQIPYPGSQSTLGPVLHPFFRNLLCISPIF